jgi:hypothetical protein
MLAVAVSIALCAITADATTIVPGFSLRQPGMQPPAGRCIQADAESGFEQQLFRDIMRQSGPRGDSARAGALLPSAPDTMIVVLNDSTTCSRVYQSLHMALDTMSARLGIAVVPDSVVLYRIGQAYRAVERRSGGHYRTHHVIDSAFRYVDRLLM